MNQNSSQIHFDQNTQTVSINHYHNNNKSPISNSYNSSPKKQHIKNIKIQPIQITSQYKFYDLLAYKKQHTCCIKIPDTIIIDRGFIKDWIFNSNKDLNHPILKKHHQNLTTLNIIKTLCTKLGYGNIINSCKSVLDLYNTILNFMKQQKNYQYIKDKKVIQILTTDNQWLSLSLLDFLDLNNQNKFNQQIFFDNWKIIQDRISFHKIQEEYQVQTTRDNHGTLIHKCHKVISVLNGFVGTLSTQLNTEDPFKDASPSKNKTTVAQSKSMQGYKFFDTYLNKKFFHMSQQLVQTVQKNLKCYVHSMNSKYVINKDREPYFMGIYDIIIRPSRKIIHSRDFLTAIEKGYIKLQEYLRPLIHYYNQRGQRNSKIKSQLNIKKGKRCKGEFCDCKCLQIPPTYLMEQKSKLPSLMAQKRKINIQIIQAIRKRRGRVIQRMKQFGYIQQNYQFDQQSSSQYQSQDSQDQNSKNVKICQNCYLFYLNSLKIFDMDSFGNLAEKKNPISLKTVRNLGRTTPVAKNKSQQKVNKHLENQFKISPKKKQSPVRNIIQQAKQQVQLNQRNQKQESYAKKLQKMKTKTNRFRAQSLRVDKITNLNSSEQKSYVRISGSKSNGKLIPNFSNINIKVNQNQSSPSPNRKSMINLRGKSSTKLNSLKINQEKIQSKIRSTIEQKQDIKQPKNISNLAKISTNQLSLSERPKHIKPIIKKIPQNMIESLSQLIEKLKKLPSSSQPEFIFYAKKYCKDNYPQYLDRKSFSSEYLPNLYDFLNNSSIILPMNQRIKKRPEMSMKRLSDLSGFPEIVSRSTFHFDTLICDQKTTIPFCIISTKMLGSIDSKASPYQNIIIFTDIFDSFIEYISPAKNMIENFLNKRVILFNRPGQSHTIYNQKGNSYISDIGIIIDKLLYRLNSELKMIDFQNDSFKFIGVGYGGYLLSAYLGYYHFLYPKIKGVLLINSFPHFSRKHIQSLQNLYKLYKNENNDPTVQLQSFLFYNKAIQSSQLTRDDIDKKAGLNSIRIQGRVYLLKNILDQKDFLVTQNFQQISYCPVQILYGLHNIFYNKNQIQQYLIYQKNQDKKEIPLRKFFEIQSGYDMMADNYDQIQFRMIQFARLGYQK